MTLLLMARRYPALSFFLLAYGISWTGILAIVGFSGLRSGELGMSRGMIVWLLMLLGPAISGIALTLLTGGKEGFADLRRRITLWRLPARWYGLLLVAPICGVLVLGVLWGLSADFQPMASAEPAKSLVIIMFLVLVAGAFIEEIGWTGFAAPKLRMLYGVFGTGLLLGVLHGLWHFLADFSGRGDASAVYYYPRFVVFWIGALTVLRILIVWAYESTESVLLAQLLHASYTAPLFVLTPPEATDAQMLLFWSLFTALFLIVTMIVIAMSSTYHTYFEGRLRARHDFDPESRSDVEMKQRGQSP
jgi:uncharacterized protein